MTDGSRFGVWKARRSDDRVPGTFRVRKVHPVGSGGVGFGAGYRLEGEVSAPGLLEPTRVSHVDSLPSVQELDGVDLPVLVDPARPEKLRIQWREVGDLHRYVQKALHARAAAERAAGSAEAEPQRTVVRQLRAEPALDDAARVGVGPAKFD